MFMKIDGANGESKDANHKNWSDIISFSWGATQPGNMASGGGLGAGKASFNDLHVVARIDKAAPAVMKHCASGKHLSKIELSVCKAGGQQIEYTKSTVEDVLVAAVQLAAEPKSEGVVVNHAFPAAKVKQQYREQAEQGGKGAESLVAWDIKQNKEVG